MSRFSLFRSVGCGCALAVSLAASALAAVPLAASALAAVPLAAIPSASAAAPAQVRLGPVPRPPSHAFALGPLPNGTRMRVAVALKPRDPAALSAYATAVATPGSAVYRDFLSVSQFAQRFGSTPAQIAAVEASLRAHGLEPGKPSPNALSIPVSASAGALARAFRLSFVRYALPSGRTAIASTAAPSLDAPVAPLIQAVVGLETLSAPRPLALRAHPGRAARRARSAATPHVATGGPRPCAAASGAAPGQQAYTADQIASAYGFSGLYRAGDLGAGQTIAVYELEPNDPADIAAYQSCYGTTASVAYVPVDGGVGSGPGSGEAALDIEDVAGLAPRAKILVYQGPNASSNAPGSGPYDTYNAIITQDRASVISTSWGTCEPMEGSPDAHAEGTLFQEAAVQGQSILSAAGDSGSEDCNRQGAPNLTPAVDDPASQPFVTGVGGTTMTGVGPPPTETAWNNGGGLAGLTGVGPGASGGGVSTFWTMPAYQSSAPGSLRVVNSSSSAAPCGASSGYCRQVPDVAADADPNTGYLIYYNGSGSVTGAAQGWQGIGGSSASAPTLAALIVLANASRTCHGSAIGFANPALYRVAGRAYASGFNDITSGNNDYTGTNGGMFAAGPGYDMVTGLGSPGSQLATRLCASILRLSNPGSQRSRVGSRVRLRVKAADYGGARLSYAAKGLPSGLSINVSSGVISGSAAAVHSSPTTVRVSDGSGQVASATFAWTVKFVSVVSSSRAVASCSRRGRGNRRICTFMAARRQFVYVPRGRKVRLSAHAFTTTGRRLAGAIVRLSDGRRRLTARTNRSGVAWFTLAPGADRRVVLSYAGGSAFYPSRIRVEIRNR